MATGPMTTTVKLQIVGRGENDAPLLADLLDQVRDFFEMVSGVAASIAGDQVERFDWRVIGLSKQSPATITVEAVPRHGFASADGIAAQAKHHTTLGLRQLQSGDARPIHFTNNVLEVADRFTRRITRGLAGTVVSSENEDDLVVRPTDATKVVKNIAKVRESEQIHSYRELGSVEGSIQTIGEDGWGKPFIVICSRITGAEVKCYLSGEALKALEQEPVAKVVWRKRRVFAVGLLRFRAEGRLYQADIARLDFSDPEESLPELADIVDRNFTSGVDSQIFLERLRNGDA